MGYLFFDLKPLKSKTFSFAERFTYSLICPHEPRTHVAKISIKNFIIFVKKKIIGNGLMWKAPTSTNNKAQVESRRK
jgi:hypothetical protein